MAEELKIFTGGLNTDINDRDLPPDAYRNAVNFRVLSTQRGKKGIGQNVKGNTVVSGGNSPVRSRTGTSKVIGSFEDLENHRMFYMVYNSDGHHMVLQYDKDTDTTSLLLDDDLFDHTGLNKGLGFEENKFITGIDMVGDMLFWVDDTPRRINVKRILDGQYTADFDDDLIAMIRRPPNMPPSVARINTGDASTPNLIKDNAFQFTWRFVYYDGEQSTFGPFSTLVNYASDDDNNNAVNVFFPNEVKIKQDVRFVEAAVRFGNTGDLFIVKRWDREIDDEAAEIDGHNAGGGLNFDFLNDSIGEGVDEQTASKPFENVPLESKALAAADNRIFLGNNKQGYDTPGKVKMTLTTNTTEVDVQGTIIIGSWMAVEQSYTTGGLFGHLYRHKAWVLYLSGYDGIQDGFYAVEGVDGSDTAKQKTSGDPIPDSTFSYPDPVNYSNLHYIGTTDSSIMQYYSWSNDSNDREFHKHWVTGKTSQVVGAPTADSFTPIRVFKTGTRYKVGIVYYDRYMRACGVVTNDDLKVSIPNYQYLQTEFVNTIKWTLSNTNALRDIPEWAEYYSVVMQLNARTRNFMQTFPYEISYVSKDADGLYETKKEPYDPTFAGIQIDISSLSKDGLGYVFNKGDLADLYWKDPNTNMNRHTYLQVIDQYGKYIVTNLADLGDLTDTLPALMELYTPYRSSSVEPFWEQGQIYEVTDPGTDDRKYGTTVGYLQGDTWIVRRKYSSISSNGVEAMSPNDKFWNEWWTDAGRPNLSPFPGVGQATKQTGIIYSDQYIAETLINGLCSFSLASVKNLAAGNGPIQRLVNTLPVNEAQGTVLLAICQARTTSMYIGAVEIRQTFGSSIVATSDGVIGTVNTLRGDYGTMNPESVAVANGHVYWLDQFKGKVVRYSTNGLFPISEYGLDHFFRDRCRHYDEGDFCFGAFDKQNNEYLLHMPAYQDLPEFIEDITWPKPDISLNFTGVFNPISSGNTDLSIHGFYDITIAHSAYPATVKVVYEGETLFEGTITEDKTLPVFRPAKSKGKFTVTSTNGLLTLKITQRQQDHHKLEDGLAKTIAFREGENKWTTSYKYSPEYFGRIGSDLYSFKNGLLYRHGDGDFNTFYGEYYPTIVAFVENGNGYSVKQYNYMAINSSSRPAFVHVGTDTLYGTITHRQSTYMKAQSFANDFYGNEGVLESDIPKDRLSPNTPGNYDERGMRGDPMMGPVAEMFLEYNDKEEVNLHQLWVLYNMSSGHKP